MTDVLYALGYLGALLVLWRYGLWYPRELPGVTRRGPLLLGHRGVRGIKPENTLAAFRYAFDAGLDGVEFDVQRSRDGHLVLYHDFMLEGKRIDTLSLAQLKKMQPDLPELSELFELANAYPGTLLNLELKSDTLYTKGLEQDAAQAVFQAGLENRVIVSSFNPVSLARLRWHAPKLRVGLLYSADLPRILQDGNLAPWLHADAIHPHESLVTTGLLRRARAKGLKLNTWTVNDPKRITSLHALGVNAIMGDDPATLRRYGAKSVT